MTSSEEEIVRDRINRYSGKEFQQLFWDILLCHYSDACTPKMQHDLGNDGYSLRERIFFAVYAPESSKYNNKETSKKISNPSPKISEDNGDYDKFLKNWKDKGIFDTWVFVTKDNLMGQPHQVIVGLNGNGDGINKEHWGIEKIVNLCANLKQADLNRIFKLNGVENVVSRPGEVETIIDLICYISDNAKLVEGGEFNSIPDPDKKLERFSEYCTQIKSEIVQSAMYAIAQKEAERVIGLDRIRVGQKVIFLKQISRRFLRKNGNDPMTSLDSMTDYLSHELSEAGKNFNHGAIRYYLISEIPKCNVFPNDNE